MIKLENYEVVGWEHAIRGMRNPMNSWEKSDSFECRELAEDGDCFTGCHNQLSCPLYGAEDSVTTTIIGPNDHDLMMRLRNAGTDHRKFMRMVTVYVDITAPLYWWKEFDTYKIGTVANSCSTMHKIHEKEFTMEDFSCEHLFNTEIVNDIIDWLNVYRDKFNEIDKRLKNNDFSSFQESRELVKKRKEFWWQMIQLLPSSYNQKRTVMLNYEVLANMYKSRKNHKLDEWREFCKWIEQLPYSELITGGKDNE